MDSRKYSFIEYRNQFHKFLDDPAIQVPANNRYKYRFEARWEEEKNLILRKGYESLFIIPKMILDYAADHKWFAYCGMHTAYSLVAYKYELSMVDPVEKELDQMWLYGLHKDRKPFITVNISKDHAPELLAFLKNVFPPENISIQDVDDETVIEVTEEDGRMTSVVIRWDALAAETEKFWTEINVSYSWLINMLRDGRNEKTGIDTIRLRSLLEQFIEPCPVDEEERKLQEGHLKLVLSSDTVEEDRLAHHIAMCENHLFTVLNGFETEDFQVFSILPYCRDWLYEVLAENYDIYPEAAYRLTEDIRKGKGASPAVIQEMISFDIDRSYRELLKRISCLNPLGSCLQKARILLLLSQKNKDQGYWDDYRILSSF